MEQVIESTARDSAPGAPTETNIVSEKTLQRETPATRATTWPEAWQKTILYKVLRVVASLRVTVVLFFLSLLLVFWGTLAQVDFGIQSVMQKYFRSLFIMVPAKYVLIAPWAKPETFPFSIPYPGGWLLGGLLMTNLVAAHIVRFKTHWTQLGIWLIHIGIGVMMVGEFFTGLYAIEGNMTIREGQSSQYLEHHHAPELAFVRSLNASEDEVVVIPLSKLRKPGVLKDDKLPCEVIVVKYMVNSKLDDLQEGEENLATHGNGKFVKVIPLPEGTGVDAEQRIDVPAAYVTLKNDGKDLGTYLLTPNLNQIDWVRIGDKDYQVSLRFQRSNCGYRIHLTKFDHEFHAGGQKAKEYRSTVNVQDLTDENGTPRGDDRKGVVISMNNPMRYHGETFYQSGTVPDNKGRSIGTVLQVVRNPAWTLPYWSCGLVAAGMLFHFILTLSRFIQRSAAYAK